MIELLFIFCSVLLFWRFIVAPYLIDSIRHNLFMIRDEAFDHYRDSKSYEDFRNLLNAYIRSAELMSWQYTIFMVITRPRPSKKEIEDFKGVIKSIRQDKNLARLVNQTFAHLNKLMILRSPTLIIFAMVLGGVYKILKLSFDPIRKLESTVEQTAKINAYAYTVSESKGIKIV